MDEDSENISGELLRATVIDHISGSPVDDHSELPATCVLCQRILTPHNDVGDLVAISMCGDCKSLFLEDSGTPTEEARQRRTTRVRRTRDGSSESIENFFSQQFSHMINLVRQSQLTGPDNESQTAETDAAARFLQRMHPRTTPSGSRRWRRVFSDTESDGFDSLYGESESNISFSGYRPFQNESDAISFSAYGGDSDVSVDGHSFLDTELFIHPDAGIDVDSDTDIDPMRAGLNQWNSDDQEEEEEEEDDTEWEEADAEENAAETSAGVHPRNSLGPRQSNGTWRGQLHSPEFEGAIRLRIGERRRTNITDVFSNLEEPEVLLPFVGNYGDYLDARGFDELLERLAEADSSRQGAPPAAVSFVNSLPRVVINEEHEKQDGLACAICKDFLSVGTVVNRLPCFHLYHPSCIVPWLRARNSCPLCRFELPTDDKDYDRGKRHTSSSLAINEIQREGMSDDSSSDDSEADGMEQVDFATEEHATGNFGRESARGRWLFLAAAPIVSLVGIVLVLWLGNPLTERGGPNGRHDFPRRGQRPHHSSDSWPPSQRENRTRRWWSLF
ncbi:E3 ubiquitin-protein ligase RING1-like [Actinidia chinensis var. chinensis]|uniref:RING-type E3 ubiquitin transferase n=1 Tax=Actinidia chinensis var. chinensis TaxID=1590841 RepID=A0A2R6RRY1_ACTCC|nr:E3 ubiquitin-protein ligase RING1-like [Actinidia chinensis var. chinensis]